MNEQYYFSALYSKKNSDEEQALLLSFWSVWSGWFYVGEWQYMYIKRTIIIT